MKEYPSRLLVPKKKKNLPFKKSGFNLWLAFYAGFTYRQVDIALKIGRGGRGHI